MIKRCCLLTTIVGRRNFSKIGSERRESNNTWIRLAHTCSLTMAAIIFNISLVSKLYAMEDSAPPSNTTSYPSLGTNRVCWDDEKEDRYKKIHSDLKLLCADLKSLAQNEPIEIGDGKEHYDKLVLQKNNNGIRNSTIQISIEGTLRSFRDHVTEDDRERILINDIPLNDWQNCYQEIKSIEQKNLRFSLCHMALGLLSILGGKFLWHKLQNSPLMQIGTLALCIGSVGLNGFLTQKRIAGARSADGIIKKLDTHDHSPPVDVSPILTKNLYAIYEKKGEILLRTASLYEQICAALTGVQNKSFVDTTSSK